MPQFLIRNELELSMELCRKGLVAGIPLLDGLWGWLYIVLYISFFTFLTEIATFKVVGFQPCLLAIEVRPLFSKFDHRVAKFNTFTLTLIISGGKNRLD